MHTTCSCLHTYQDQDAHHMQLQHGWNHPSLSGNSVECLHHHLKAPDGNTQLHAELLC
jgi:hypothetical protein